MIPSHKLPYQKLTNVTIRINPDLWKEYRALQKRRGVLLMRAIEDHLRSAIRAAEVEDLLAGKEGEPK